MYLVGPTSTHLAPIQPVTYIQIRYNIFCYIEFDISSTSCACMSIFLWKEEGKLDSTDQKLLAAATEMYLVGPTSTHLAPIQPVTYIQIRYNIFCYIEFDY